MHWIVVLSIQCIVWAAAVVLGNVITIALQKTQEHIMGVMVRKVGAGIAHAFN